jgi:hypothetical protein
MNTLRELIGQKVIFNYRDEQYQDEIRCTVLDVCINDWYFNEKGEPIYITVDLMPNETYNGDFIDVDDFFGVNLSEITR